MSLLRLSPRLAARPRRRCPRPVSGSRRPPPDPTQAPGSSEANTPTPAATSASVPALAPADARLRCCRRRARRDDVALPAPTLSTTARSAAPAARTPPAKSDAPADPATAGKCPSPTDSAAPGERRTPAGSAAAAKRPTPAEPAAAGKRPALADSTAPDRRPAPFDPAAPGERRTPADSAPPGERPAPTDPAVAAKRPALADSAAAGRRPSPADSAAPVGSAASAAGAAVSCARRDGSIARGPRDARVRRFPPTPKISRRNQIGRPMPPRIMATPVTVIQFVTGVVTNRALSTKRTRSDATANTQYAVLRSPRAGRKPVEPTSAGEREGRAT